MANKLTAEVDSYIKRNLPPAKKELKYVKGEDWSEISSVDMRSTVYSLHKMIIDRNVGAALKLHTLSGEDINHPRVKAAMKVFLEFFTLLEKRYSNMISLFDWTSFKLKSEDEKESSRAKSEIKMQSAVLDDINKLELKLTNINFGEEDKKVKITLHNKTPIPFMMSGAAEEKFPEIKEYLDGEL